jgi:hypothetical protein
LVWIQSNCIELNWIELNWIWFNSTKCNSIWIWILSNVFKFNLGILIQIKFNWVAFNSSCIMRIHSILNHSNGTECLQNQFIFFINSWSLGVFINTKSSSIVWNDVVICFTYNYKSSHVFFVCFYKKHNNRPNLTSSWHPQVKLIGKKVKMNFTYTPLGLNKCWVVISPFMRTISSNSSQHLRELA